MHPRACLLVLAILLVPPALARHSTSEPVGERRAQELTSRAHTAPPAQTPLDPLPGENENGRVLAVRYALVALASAACLLTLYAAFSRNRSGIGRR